MFKQKAIKNANIEWDDANQINQNILYLKKGCVQKIVVDEVLIKSKIAWKVAIYYEACRYRIVELSLCITQHWQNKDFVTCFILVRALTETIATLYDTELKLANAIKECNLDKINNIIENKTFSNKLDDLFVDRTDLNAINVLTLVNKLDKLISGVRKNYDILSEYTHANYFGTFGSYAKIDQEKIEVKFSRDRHTHHGVYMVIQANLGLLSIAANSLDTSKAQIERIAEIHAEYDLSELSL